jgi:hypothetical protein
MSEPAQPPSRALALAKTVAKFAAAWGLLYWVVRSGVPYRASLWFEDALERVFAGFPAILVNVERVYYATREVFAGSYVTTLFFATLLAPLGASVRMVARARIRSGAPDFLDPVRAWLAAHPKAAKWLNAAPALLLSLLAVWPHRFERAHLDMYVWDVGRELLPLALAGWAMTRVTGKGVRELLAPTLATGESDARFEISPDEIVFDAVAVTPRTLAMVVAFTAITLAVPTFIATRPILQLFNDRSIFYFVAAYIAFAVGGAYAFRRASRVSVGIDGVHVRGTARERFYAYRDVDSVRARGGDIELVRKGRAVVRLQLHGEDAVRRDAVLARITEHLASVKEGKGAAAAQLVSTSSKGDLARVAQGAGDYRMATLTREQLWALVEGPEVDHAARKAAAEALVASNDPREKDRLRVAADLCAQPNVRVALQEIAGEAEPETPETGVHGRAPSSNVMSR